MAYYRIVLFIIMAQWDKHDGWRDCDYQCIYAVTPSKVDMNTLKRILEEGIEAGFSAELVSLVQRCSCPLVLTLSSGSTPASQGYSTGEVRSIFPLP